MDPFGALRNILGLGTPQKKKQDQKSLPVTLPVQSQQPIQVQPGIHGPLNPQYDQQNPQDMYEGQNMNTSQLPNAGHFNTFQPQQLQPGVGRFGIPIRGQYPSLQGGNDSDLRSKYNLY